MKTDTETEINTAERKDGRTGAVRYILTGLLFMNCLLLYAMRLNLSVAIVAMVNSTSAQTLPALNESCRNAGYAANDTDPVGGSTGEFDWDQSQQAMVTYAFFVGYLLTQFPGGYLAETYSVTWVLGLGTGVTGLLTCFTSVAARTSLYAFLALRVLEGLAEGVMFPAVYVFISKWAPVQEQGFMLDFVMAGTGLGTVLTMPLTAFLCKSSLGWPSAFYVFGLGGVVFSILWMIFAADSPECHRSISPEERDYIVHNRPASIGIRSKSSVPWQKMLLSPAVWFVSLQKLSGTMNYYMILTELPSYLHYIFGISLIEDGNINGIMNAGFSVTLVLSGLVADKILTKKLASKNVVRKSSVALALLVPSLCMTIIPAAGCRYEIVLALILMNCVFGGMSGGGDGLIILDIAPKYAGSVQAVVNTVSNVAGILAPQLVGVLTQNNNTIHQWNLVFYCTAAFTIVGASLFLVFGITEEQEWAKYDQIDHNDETAIICLDEPTEAFEKRHNNSRDKRKSEN